jgi:hypothetical protein
VRYAFLILGIIFSGAAISAAPVSDTYVIPVAGHVVAADGTAWVSDLTMHNVGESAIVVDLAGVASGGQAMSLEVENVTIEPHGTIALRDIVRPGGLGALILAGSGPFSLSSRVTHGEIGTDVMPASEFLQSGQAFLSGLSSTAARRTNLGLFAVAGATVMTVEITLIDETGRRIGTRTFEIPAGQLTHLQFNTSAIVNETFDSATATVRVTGGEGLVSAYASVVDNRSGDASFIPAAVMNDISTLSMRDLLLTGGLFR